MNCKQFEKLLGRYMDGELDEASEKAMRSHIAVCNACAREFAAFEKLANGLSQTENEPVPVGFEQRWKQVIKQASAKQRKASFGRLMPALAASVAAIAVVGALLATGVLNHAAPNTVSFRTAQDVRGSVAIGAGQASQASHTSQAGDAGGSKESVMMAPAPEPTQAPAAGAAEPTQTDEPAASVPSASSTADIEPNQMKMAVQEDTSQPIELEVSADTLDKLENSFASADSVKIEYTRDGNRLTIMVTEENQTAVASITKDAGLDISPQAGETYVFYAQ